MNASYLFKMLTSKPKPIVPIITLPKLETFQKYKDINYIFDSSRISRKDLDTKMESLNTKFCFIKCLRLSDRERFIKEYLSVTNSDLTQYKKYYDRGVIKVSTWLDIMHKIELDNRYCVYRESYWGENTSKLDIIPISEKYKSNYKSLLVEFNPECHTCAINLLIANKHISRIEVFSRSRFVNKKQWFWDSIIG